jgi:hypothetical protein
MGGKQKFPDTTKKVLDWAKEYGKHFCIHDVMGFFREIPEANIGGGLSHMVRDGKLMRADSKETCQMCDRKHSFFIYHKKPNMPSHPQPQMASYHKWSVEDIKKLKELLNEGKTARETAQIMSLSEASVRRGIARYNIKDRNNTVLAEKWKRIDKSHKRAKYGSKKQTIIMKLVKPETTARCPYCFKKVVVVESKEKD